MKRMIVASKALKPLYQYVDDAKDELYGLFSLAVGNSIKGTFMALNKKDAIADSIKYSEDITDALGTDNWEIISTRAHAHNYTDDELNQLVYGSLKSLVSSLM